LQLTDLGPILKEARKKAGLSQEQLAAPLGMSRATISAIESGRCEEIGFLEAGHAAGRCGARAHRWSAHFAPDDR